MTASRGVGPRELFLREFPTFLTEETATIFVGAGVSMGAGYPSWKKLLREIGEELGVDSDDIADLAALAQWHIRRSAGATKIRQIIRNELAIEHPIPDSLEIVARLPIRHIWTTNYDRLIERAFSGIGRPLDPISSTRDLALKPRPGAVRLYKMHGTVDRLEDIVISTDDFELFRSKRGAFLPLLQAHLSSLSMLFIGLSFTDPNVRHVLSLIRESFTDTPPEHFALVRPPQREDYRSDEEHAARLRQHELWTDDLQRYGLRAIPVDSYDEVQELLRAVERRLAERRVWVSGSWPVGIGADRAAEYVHEIAYGIGRGIGELGLTLVNGFGLLVSSAAVSGFLSALQHTGSWDLDRRLIARPFPQPLAGREPDTQQWAMLREELARLSGLVVFVGGLKMTDGKAVDAEGVYDELTAATNRNAFLLPIGATGGTSAKIAQNLLTTRTRARAAPLFPSEDELKALLDQTKSPSELVALTLSIIKRVVGI